jgi:sugar lactone lactonase YvrE
MRDADPDVQLAVASPSLLGESPVWHPREQALYYVDIAGRRLNRFDPRRGDLSHWDLHGEPGSCCACLDGSLLLAMRDGLWRFRPASGETTRLAPPPYDASKERFNDGKCDPLGRFWIGTMYEPRDAPRAALYCYADGRLERKAEDVTVSNGLAWSPDGRTMYWSDTTSHSVHAFDVDPVDGELSRRRLFASFPVKRPDQDLASYGGRPDGAAVDAEGCYWLAMFEGQRLLRLSPEGELIRELRLPVRCPTMPCFGGADLKTLYITTGRANRPPAELAEQPWAGCVLSLRVDVPGLPSNLAI